MPSCCPPGSSNCSSEKTKLEADTGADPQQKAARLQAIDRKLGELQRTL